MSFSELANENEFKVHKIIQETQVTKSDLHSCLAFKHQLLDEIWTEAFDKALFIKRRFLVKIWSINLQERRITDNLKEARNYYNN